ncbi:(2Fe-2S)-binding protein [Sphingomicrobium sediminis]|uniref:2Fe-2S iron-sulfur cluster-binding protein n=1 Tax=Sphingomicrobium sediminis TaxID=2950949 RepID=A0A9X2EN14_9SPHN|nr:2Fe-2S iron-sulfur cluster-binding protein [Sphingomicrobium sediminis]MCM8558389.1 2Fe-2S iron-sulfur cluster-binding protein [Sphingomicrobium sediminis]
MTRFTLNGRPLAFDLDPQTPLLFALRDAANITSAKYGCDDQSCHACTVLVDGQAVRSCTLTIARAEGAVVQTVEGLAPDDPLFSAWEDEQVSLCGFCDPGFMCALSALLAVNSAPTEEELAAIPNRCPCGAGPRIRKAAQLAARRIRQASAPQAVQTADSNLTEGFSLGSGGDGN